MKILDIEMIGKERTKQAITSLLDSATDTVRFLLREKQRTKDLIECSTMEQTLSILASTKQLKDHVELLYNEIIDAAQVKDEK